MPQTAIIILAAGASKRLGKPKQLLVYNGKTLLQNTIDEVMKVENSIPFLVISEEFDFKTDSDIKIIENKESHLGISSSIKIGLKKIIDLQSEIKNCIFTVSDQPFISVKIFSQLIQKCNTSNKGIIASFYEETIGVPMLFNKKYFEELLQLSNDEGAKKIAIKHKDDLETIDFPKGKIDIDTPEDYKKLCSK